MGSSKKLATRVLNTESPVMAEIQELCRTTKGAVSLAQGVVYWQPPEEARNKLKELLSEPMISQYGPDEGIPQLRGALMQKLQTENNLVQSKVMVTAGANQAFTNLVLALCDPGDTVVMFAPYFFNAYMTFQMTGVNNILVIPSNAKTLYPDADKLEQTLKASPKAPTPKVVSVVNPGNPSGTYIPERILKKISDLCREAGSWLIVDNTYELFMYDDLKHSCVEGDHVFNIFSFSKAYGMMGWRVGYIAYPAGVAGLSDQLVKVQDNIPICASIMSQHLALYSLEVGTDWVKKQVRGLVRNRDIIKGALSQLGGGVAVRGGQGAIYLWVRLPDGSHDNFEIVRWLARRHKVVVIPGSACGCSGHLRISFGGLSEAETAVAAERLRKGLQEFIRDGMVKG